MSIDVHLAANTLRGHLQQLDNRIPGKQGTKTEPPTSPGRLGNPANWTATLGIKRVAGSHSIAS